MFYAKVAEEWEVEVVSEFCWCDTNLVVYVSEAADHVEFDQAYQFACGFLLLLLLLLLTHICSNGVDDVEIWDPGDYMAVDFIVLLLTY